MRKTFLKENMIKMRIFNKNLFYILLIFTIFLLDRISKLYILNLPELENQASINILPFLNLYLIWNTGVGFGLFSSDQEFNYNLLTILIILINILIVIMIFKSNNYTKLFLLMILGGSLGNLFDRIYYSAVPDFIDIHFQNFHWFVFNIADIFITIGVVCLIFDEIFFKNLKSKND